MDTRKTLCSRRRQRGQRRRWQKHRIDYVHHTVASGHDHHAVELGCGQLQVFSSESAWQQFNAHPMPSAIVAEIHHSGQRPFPCRSFEIGKTGLTSPGPFQDAALAAYEIRLELGLRWKKSMCASTANRQQR